MSERTKAQLDAIAKGYALLDSLSHDVLDSIEEKAVALSKVPPAKDSEAEREQLTNAWSEVVAEMAKADNVVESWEMFDDALEVVLREFQNVPAVDKQAKQEKLARLTSFGDARKGLRKAVKTRSTTLEKVKSKPLPEPGARKAGLAVVAEITLARPLVTAPIERVCLVLLDFLESNEAKEIVQEIPVFMVDLDAFLTAIPVPRIVVWDSSFAKDIIDNLVPAANKNNLIGLKVDGDHKIPYEMMRELTKAKAGSTLIPDRFANYLASRLDTIRPIEMNLTVVEEDDIIKIWSRTAKGSVELASGKTTVAGFKSKADYDILKFCYRKDTERIAGKEKRPVVVLSSDADVFDTIRAFKRVGRMLHVFPYRFSGGRITIAA